jgi:CRISPR system Cascade subunit CasE
MFLSRIELGAHAAEHEAFWREVSQPYGAHQALWTLLGRGPKQQRDFLFRAEESLGRPRFLVLSAHKPEAPAGGLWCVDPKPFAPALKVGQRLSFRLRASPVVRRGERVEGKKNKRVHRHDVVMDSARKLTEAGQSLPDPATLARDAGVAWLGAQAQRGGFWILEAPTERIGEDGLIEAEAASAAVRVEGYRQHHIVRRGATPVRFSTLEFEGLLEVSDPAVFLAKVAAGFGPQKAFGCGLMLLKRA